MEISRDELNSMRALDSEEIIRRRLIMQLINDLPIEKLNTMFNIERDEKSRVRPNMVKYYAQIAI